MDIEIEMTEAEREAVANVVARIFGRLDDRGSEEFEAVAVRYGLLLRCSWCSANVAVDERFCGECGKTVRW